MYKYINYQLQSPLKLTCTNFKTIVHMGTYCTIEIQSQYNMCTSKYMLLPLGCGNPISGDGCGAGYNPIPIQYKVWVDIEN